MTQTVRNLLMDLKDAVDLARVRFLIRDRDAKYPTLIDQILSGTGITTVLTGIRMPRMNAITERWMKTLRTELLDRMLTWNQIHLRHALREYDRHYNLHRAHRSLAAEVPPASPAPPLEPDQLERLAIRWKDRLGGVIHEHGHAARLHGRSFRHVHRYRAPRTQRFGRSVKTSGPMPVYSDRIPLSVFGSPNSLRNPIRELIDAEKCLQSRLSNGSTGLG